MLMESKLQYIKVDVSRSFRQLDKLQGDPKLFNNPSPCFYMGILFPNHLQKYLQKYQKSKQPLQIFDNVLKLFQALVSYPLVIFFVNSATYY